MEDKNPLSSSEIGMLWLTYQEKTLIMRFLEYFIEKSEDFEAINMMGGLWQELQHFVKKMQDIFKQDGVAIPRAFTKEDVNLEAPKLYDNGFDILFVRILKQVSMGLYSISMGMSYREDIMSIYQNLSSISQRAYKLCSEYLLEKGIMTLPPNVSKPKTTEFVKSTSYLSGFNPFKKDRPLNDIELGIIHHGIEANNIGLQLITGFAQVSAKKEVRNYFIRGMELAKKQLKVFEEMLIQNDTQFSATLGSTVTTSTVPPFSEKLMMFCIFLLNGFGIVGNSFGTMFTLRNDISLKTALGAKDIYTYAMDGVKLMIKNGWLEEIPQTENRKDIINRKQ